jgi:hypothetical protein
MAAVANILWELCRTWWWALVACLAGAALVVLADLTGPPVSLRVACDRAFELFMNASSQVDLERAKVLLKDGDCAVMRRFRAQAQ